MSVWVPTGFHRPSSRGPPIPQISLCSLLSLKNRAFRPSNLSATAPQTHTRRQVVHCHIEPTSRHRESLGEMSADRKRTCTYKNITNYVHNSYRCSEVVVRWFDRRRPVLRPRSPVRHTCKTTNFHFERGLQLIFSKMNIQIAIFL